MKKSLFSFLILSLVLVSCGTDGSHFKLDGHLLNLNQGEFYVYSTDGLTDGLDTIQVNAGRFSKEWSCKDPGTLVLVFPNYTEVVIFAEPGKSANLKGDASHLKEVKVTGTSENKLMNSFREMIKDSSPIEIKKYAEQFVKDHPESLVSTYLVTRYFLLTSDPDYTKATLLLEILKKAQPANGRIAQMLVQVQQQKKVSVGNRLPSFTATDINGNKVTQDAFTKGEAVIYLWASWEYESCNIQRNLKIKNRELEGKVHLLGISLDASKSDCKTTIKRDDITTPTVCDGQMFDGNLVTRLGFTSVPDNIYIKDGKIVGRNLTSLDLQQKLGK